MLFYLTVLTFLVLFGTFYKSIIYFLLYWVFMRFTGAHTKPTSEHDRPDERHEKNKLTRVFRWWERYTSKKVHFTPEPAAVPTLLAEEANPSNFEFMSAGKTRPVYVPNFMEDTQACKHWREFDYLEEVAGKVEVNVLCRKPNQDMAYRSFNTAVGLQKMPLEEALNLIQDDTDAAYYINNVTSVFADKNGLRKDLGLFRLKTLDTGVSNETMLKENVFIGSMGTQSWWHRAAGGNFFMQVTGKKRWELIDPRFSKNMRGTPARDFAFEISGATEDEISTLPRYEIVLHPGDILYIPAWWWHRVKTEASGIGCALRDHTAYRQMFQNDPMATMLSPYWWRLNPWLLKAVERIKGRDWMRQQSLKSEDSVNESIAGKQKKLE